MSVFDVRKHDFLARIGTLHINDELTLSTPAVCSMADLFPSLLNRKFTNLPQSASQKDADIYFVAGNEPVAIHTQKIPDTETGVYLFANWNNCLSDSKRFLDTYETLWNNIRSDIARYAPASALPSNAAMLIYCGFDLFDYTAVDLATLQGKFCVPEGEFSEDWMDKGICCCEGCKTHNLKLHNRLTLEREIANARVWIERGQLRELLETRCRLHAPQVELLRRIDRSNVFDSALPVVRNSRFLANAGESIYRREIDFFEDRLISRYVPPRSDVCVLLPCAARKPYSLSRSHQMFVRVIDGRAHEVIITSPLGIVPRELELVYPAGHYDVPVTGFWDAEEQRILVNRVSTYLAKHHYDRIICHLNGGSKEVVETAAQKLGISLELTCTDEHPLSSESLRALNTALNGCHKQKNDYIKGTFSWQFGENVDTTGLVIKGRYPQVKVLQKKQQLFTTDPTTGLLRPTHEGWMRISGYRVIISPGFMPQGDILAPGIAECDDRIREGDEVFVVGENYAATGKAVMNANEMRTSNRGIAVKVRKTRKQ